VTIAHCVCRGGCDVANSDDLRLIRSADAGQDECLAEADGFLRALLAASPMGVVVYRAEGPCVVANEAAARGVGASLEQLLQQDYRQTSSWQHAGLVDLADEMLATGEPQRHALHTVSSFGREVFLDLRLHPLDVADQRLLLVLFIDVTKEQRAERELRRHAEEALEESETRFRLLAENIDDVFWMASPGVTEMLYVSPAYEEVWGRPRSEVYTDSRAFSESVHPADRERVLGTFAHHASGRWDLEYRIIRPDGQIRWMRDRGFPILGETGDMAGMCGIASDVTDLKQTGVELQTTVDALRLANRDLEQFAYAAAHDLREPLRNLVTHSQLLQRSLGDRLQDRDAVVLNRIADAAGRMDDLVRGMLDYGQIGAHFVETDLVDLEAVVRDVRDALSWRLEDADARLTCDDMPRVMGNRRRLTQLMNNLVVNALKFHGSEPAEIHLSTRRRNGEWVICVTDNGVGIHPDHHERIFDMFERLHDGSEIPGVGIGLAVCKKIIELHGGQIWVESRSGEGSRFCFTLKGA
jgi:PAS domain S-box-containing protein